MKEWELKSQVIILLSPLGSENRKKLRQGGEKKEENTVIPNIGSMQHKRNSGIKNII